MSDYQSHVAALPASTLLIISFHAPWAAPCAQMATVLSTLASEYPVVQPPSTSWISINAEDLSDVSEAYEVSAVPFLALVRGGKTLETVSGSSVVKVREAIERHASKSMPGAPSVEAPASATELPEAGSGESEKAKEELFKRLGDLVKAAPVMLFMKGTPSEPKCGFSRQLVGILRDNSVKYGFFNILADDEVRQGLKEFADWPTFPQLWVDGELVGGLDIVSISTGMIQRDVKLGFSLSRIARLKISPYRSRRKLQQTTISSRHIVSRMKAPWRLRQQLDEALGLCMRLVRSRALGESAITLLQTGRHQTGRIKGFRGSFRWPGS